MFLLTKERKGQIENLLGEEKEKTHEGNIGGRRWKIEEGRRRQSGWREYYMQIMKLRQIKPINPTCT